VPTDLLTFAHAHIESAQGQFNSDRKAPYHRATISRYKVALELLTAYAAKRSRRKTAPPVAFAEVDADFVAGFTAYLTAQGYAANSVVKYGKTLREFLKRAKEHKELGKEVNPEVFHRRLTLKEEPSEQVYLNADELAAFYRVDLSAHPRLERARDLFIVGSWTGLRFGDLSRIQPEHIEGGRLRVRTSKTGKEVTIPLHPCIPAIMAKYGGRVPSGISNQKQNGYIKEAAAMVPELQVKTMEGRTKGGIRREVARAKWERITTHTARRSFASNCYRDGIPARTIMAVTGHRTEQAFMRYIRLTNDEHADIMAKSSLFTMPVMKAV
jgi:integrase